MKVVTGQAATIEHAERAGVMSFIQLCARHFGEPHGVAVIYQDVMAYAGERPRKQARVPVMEQTGPEVIRSGNTDSVG